VEVDAGNAVFERDETNNAAIDDADLVVAPALVVSLGQASVPEGSGTAATRGQVTRSGDTSGPLVVRLVADRAEIAVPATVTIPPGAASTSFVVGVTDNALVDGTRTARIIATSIGYGAGEASLTITDGDIANLTVTFPTATVSEGAGSIVATVTRNTSTDAALTVSLNVDKS
ncbi:MAG: hypothetical protein NZ523_00405, partial [Elioraea sp.]|nr:hypothetical protein [Elioraea sp.]